MNGMPLHRGGLGAALTAARGSVALEIDVAVGPGEVLAVLGPNGAGKTTLLRLIAGLAPIDSGLITVGSHVVDDPEHDIFVAAAGRSVGMVFQNRALFSSMTVLDNVAFGLRAAGMPRAESRDLARATLSRLGIAELAPSFPGRLSGGEAQRVALARALATRPRVLLLDEPLAALDAGARPELRRVLAEHLVDFDGACLVVTHDPLDAIALAERTAILERGRIVQEGRLDDILEDPRCEYAQALTRESRAR